VENLSVPFDRRVWQESLALRDAGWEVSVICPQGTRRDTEAYAEIDGIKIHRYPLTAATGGPQGYVKEYGSALWHTWRLAKKVGRVDVVHACNPPDLFYLIAKRLKRTGARFVFDQHDLVPELYESRFNRGKDFLYRVQYPDGRIETLLSVPNYSFVWQLWYNLAEPLQLPKGTKILCTAHFDNSTGNRYNPDPSKEVGWGDQSWDEMMVGFFNLVFDARTSIESINPPVKRVKP